MNNPAISVIIPMYNAAEFIAECLDSILLQTFQDFEVIVVDDCSDDNCVEIAESYFEKFDGRLRVTRTEKNSGGGGYVPRNIGLSMASGEYVYFVDADDLILLTALETLYAAAKDNDADVVYTAAHYWMKQPDRISKQRDMVGEDLLAQGLEDEPTLIVDDPDKILRDIILRGHHRTPWAKFLKREFLTENKILFPEIILGGDNIWTFLVYARAKRFLRLPTPVYFLRRYHTTSIIKTKRSIAGYNPELNAGFIAWFKTFGTIAKQIDFLRANIDLAVLSAKDFFDYFVRGLYAEDKWRCFVDIREILLREVSGDAANLIAPFVKLMEEAIKPPCLSTCAVSVIVSLYNYGKYVGECLDSLLLQTFTDFEVIVVDDCSTDNSVEVVESYMERFNGRLQLKQMETNTGGGGTPRNIGLTLANGEYVFFMDADDVLLENGLEEMHALAVEYYADVVYCEKYFTSEGVGQEFRDNVRIADKKCQVPPFVDEPLLEERNMIERINRAVRFNYWVTAWLRLVRRDLLLTNGIKFLSLIGSNDVGWSYQVLFCCKRLLRVPNAYYIRRMHDESVSFRQRTVPEHVHKWMDRSIRSLRYMSDFMDGVNFFRNNSKARHKVLSHFLESDFAKIEHECKDLAPFQVANIFREQFGDYLGKYDVLVSMLCASVNSKRKNMKRQERRITELNQKLSRVSPLGYPAVSVIIPLYNAEEFIAECLDSLKAQNFRDFEVIVVDDCSTDSSVEIVESYKERFGKRLKLAQTKTNSGGGGYVPRNLGLKISRGEYVYFVDADDFLLSTALSRLYAAAKGFDADVVYMSSYYNLQGENDVRTMREPLDKKIPTVGLRGNPVLFDDDPDKNINYLLFSESMPACWRKFVRRDFLTTNDIAFPEISTGGDFLWTIDLYAHCKKFLRITTPFYFYRSYNPESILRKQRKPAEQVAYWTEAFAAWSRAFSVLADRIDILRDNPAYRHKALTLKFNWCMGHIAEEMKRVYASSVYENLCREFGAENDSPDLSTAAFLFGNFILSKRRVSKLNDRIAELEDELTQLKSKE